MNKKRLLLLILIFYSVLNAQSKYNYKDSTFTQIKQLSDIEKDQLQQSFVIIKGDLLFVETEEICGISLAKVIISPKLIKDAEERFYISHLIRNILIEGIVIKNYDNNEKSLNLDPYILIEENYIIKYKKDILKVLYYLMHRNYFDLYGKLQNSGEKIFTSSLLKPIEKDLLKLKRKMLKEKGIILVDSIY